MIPHLSRIEELLLEPVLYYDHQQSFKYIKMVCGFREAQILER